MPFLDTDDRMTLVIFKAYREAFRAHDQAPNDVALGAALHEAEEALKEHAVPRAERRQYDLPKYDRKKTGSSL